MHPIVDGLLPQQAEQIRVIAENLFADQLKGIYLYGSATLGGLHPQSDVDILILIKGEMSKEVREVLTKQLLSLSGKVGCISKRPLEVTVVRQDDIVPWQFPPKCTYMYGEWMRKEIEAGEIPQACVDPDLVILLWQARRHSSCLTGEDAANCIPQIPIEEVHRAIQSSLPSLIASLHGDERNVLLTLCRMWYTVETGEICPKNVAAEWAIPKLPTGLAPWMKMAKEAYLGKCVDRWNNSAELELLVAFLKNKLERLLEQKLSSPKDDGSAISTDFLQR